MTPLHLTFDYSKIDPLFHADESPHAKLKVFKAAPKGYEDKGLNSMALLNDDQKHLNEVKEIIESGNNDAIERLLQRHAQYYYNTALLSTTLNPETAQFYAPSNAIGK